MCVNAAGCLLRGTMRALPPGFHPPDFSRPVVVADVVAACVDGAVVKGMFMQSVVDELKRASRPVPLATDVIAFKDYPIAVYIELIIAGAAALYPDVPAREGIRRLGRVTWDALRESLIGKVVFGVLGNDIQAITRLLPKAYSIAGKGTHVELIAVHPDASHVRLAGVALIDSYHLGAFEGVCMACGYQCDVHVRVDGAATELFTRWWR